MAREEQTGHSREDYLKAGLELLADSGPRALTAVRLAAELEVTTGSFVIRPDEKETGWPLAGGSNPHPPNKQLVANRLGDIALEKTYNKSVGREVFGPMIDSHKVEGNKIRVSFAHAKGLAARDGKPLTEFMIAGADNKFVTAKATVDGDTVVVHAAGVTKPKNVRFGWHKVANPNLVNSAGLPASPFQTDNWTGGTGLEH